MLHSPKFDIQHENFQKRKKQQHFDPTQGIVDKCTGKTLSDMLLYATLSNMNIPGLRGIIWTNLVKVY